MILKKEYFDQANRVATQWVPNIKSANRAYDSKEKCDVLNLTLLDGSVESVRINGNVGLYLCNDEGKTMDVLSRFDRSKGAR